jgi:hypothetical protein
LCISPFFCKILLCSISCSDLNGRVGVGSADGVDGGASFELNNVLSFIIQNKVEAPETQRGRERERDSKGAEVNL